MFTIVRKHRNLLCYTVSITTSGVQNLVLFFFFKLQIASRGRCCLSYTGLKLKQKKFPPTTISLHLFLPATNKNYILYVTGWKTDQKTKLEFLFFFFKKKIPFHRGKNIYKLKYTWKWDFCKGRSVKTISKLRVNQCIAGYIPPPRSKVKDRLLFWFCFRQLENISLKF